MIGTNGHDFRHQSTIFTSFHWAAFITQYILSRLELIEFFSIFPADCILVEKPTKCISSRKLIEVNAQVQFIDFEGRSDGGSLLQILSQLRPRRIVVVRGTPDNIDIVSKHCVQSIGARVFTPKKGDIVDATTETHIYQVRLTEALISQLFFQKGKDAEIAWMDSEVVVRKKQIAAIGSAADMEVDHEEPTEGN